MGRGFVFLYDAWQLAKYRQMNFFLKFQTPWNFVASVLLIFMLDARSDEGQRDIGVLKIEIVGETIVNEYIEVAVYSENERALFPNQLPKLKQRMLANNGKATFEFDRIPYGRYAVVSFQDKNNNDLLDRNIFGVPVEIWGVSGRRPSFGQPEFSTSEIFINEHPYQLRIKME